MAQLICENATLGYDGRPVVRGLTFSVGAGDYLCILGENGCGKTTLMKAILQLHPPLSGSIRLADGVQAGQIGYLPQQTAIQRDFPASVREIVRSGCLSRMKGRAFYAAAEKRLAEESMEKMDILPLAGRCYRDLSGGQQQRVLLARALCSAERMLLLDEPVTGLDPQAAAELYALIARLNRQGMTIVMISHDTDAALANASHVLQLGKTFYFGPAGGYAGPGAGGRPAAGKEDC